MGTVHHSTEIGAASALSANVDAHLAAESIAEAIGERVNTPDLLCLFAAADHASQLGLIGDVLRSALRPRCVIGVSAGMILADREETEGQPALSALALSLPGVEITPFRYRDLPPGDPHAPGVGKTVARDLHISDQTQGVVLLADPFSVPANRALALMDAAKDAADLEPPLPVVGGMASSARQPGGNQLLLDDHLDAAGAVGVVVSGDVRFDTLVSQGCRPIGKPMVITACQRNIVKQLGGKRALDALQELVETLDRSDRELLQKGLFVGVVVNEYKPRFGRGDFLVRSVLGVDKDSGALAFGDLVRVGQTVQFHLRDADTASEDLQLLLDGQRVADPASAALVFSCNGRGRALFGHPNHDADAVADALAREKHACPTAGFFAAGELGPIGDRSFVHGHSASIAMFRHP